MMDSTQAYAQNLLKERDPELWNWVARPGGWLNSLNPWADVETSVPGQMRIR